MHGRQKRGKPKLVERAAVSVQAAEGEDGAEVTNDDQLQVYLEKLLEKRRALRDQGLNQLIDGLCLTFSPDFVTDRKTTILEAVKYSLKTGTNEERALACKLASICCITLGFNPDSVAFFDELYPTLRSYIVDPEGDRLVQAAALDFLGTSAFVTVEDPEKIQALFSLFSDYFKNVKSSDAAPAVDAAISSWTLLATVTSIPITDLLAQGLKGITEHVMDTDIDVQISCCEAIAVLSSLMLVDGDFDVGTFDAYVDNFDEIQDFMNEIAGSKVSSKKDKARVLRVKDVLRLLESKVEVRDFFVIKKQRFDFESWKEIFQLDLFRRVLGKGFQDHFEKNELLHQIFNVSIDETAAGYTMSAIEKRKYLGGSSDISKDRTQDRSRGLDSKFAIQTTFDDDE